MRYPKRPKCLHCGHLIETAIIEALARRGEQAVFCRDCLLGESFRRAQQQMLRKPKVKS